MVGKFSDQIVNVLNSGVHTEPARGGEAVAWVACQNHSIQEKLIRHKCGTVPVSDIFYFQILELYGWTDNRLHDMHGVYVGVVGRLDRNLKHEQPPFQTMVH